MARTRVLAYIGLIALTSVWAFLPDPNATLLYWDDVFHLSRNPHLNGSWNGLFELWQKPFMNFYMPTVYSIWFVLWKIVGEWNVTSLKLLNVFFHAANSVLAYFVIRRFLTWFFGSSRQSSRDFVGLVAVAFFALHPARLEAVVWISGLKDLVATFFALSSLLAFWNSKETVERKNRYALLGLSIIAFALSLAAKPAFITWPIVYAGLSLIVDDRYRRKILLRVLPFFGIAALFALVILSGQPSHRLLPIPDFVGRIHVALDAIFFYLRQSIGLEMISPDHGRTPHVVVDDSRNFLILIATAVVLIVIAWAARSKDWICASSSAFFLFILTLLPVSGLVPFYFQQTSTVADRYSYGPAIWISCLIATGLMALLRQLNHLPLSMKRMVSVALVLPMAILLAVSLSKISGIKPKWNDDATFFNWMLERNSKSFSALNYLGDMEMNAGRFDAAEDYYLRSIGTQEWQPYPRHQLAHLKYLMGNKEEAIRLLEELLARYPGYAQAAASLSNLKAAP